jgi:putative ABC transport system permease protein
MIALALRGLATRKLRSVMVAFAVVLGVAMIAGSFVLTDTIRSAFTGIYKESTAGSDVIISGKPIVDGSLNGDATIPESLLQQVRATQGVKAAAGGISADFGARLTDHNGKLVDTKGAASLALGFRPTDAAFSPLRLASGRWASGPSEVVLDRASATTLNYRLGEELRIAGQMTTGTFTVVGTATVGGSTSIGGATVAAFDLPTAQKLVGLDGRLSEIDVAAQPGVTPEALVSQLAPTLPATAQALTRTQEQDAQIKDVDEGLGFIKQFLLAFAGLALFVGAFVIFNTLSITVAQRTRELATLRLIGASGKQIRRSVVAEGAILGAVASVVGLGAGIGLAKGLNALFAAAGLDMPQAAMVIAPRTIVWSLAVGTIVTVIASLVPAIRATRIAPTAAVREGLPASSGGRRHTLITGAAAVVAGIGVAGAALLADGIEIKSRLLALAVSLIVMFIGVGLVLPRLIGPIARIVGAPSARFFGEAGRLGRDNATRNPGRTAATASALMVGLALIACVASLGQGLRQSDRNAISDQVMATHIVSSEDGFTPLPTTVGATVADVPGVRVASSIRQEQAATSTGEVTISGVDPATIGAVINVTWTSGSQSTWTGLQAGQAVVSDTYAKDAKLTIGSRTRIQTPDGTFVPLSVAGIYKPSRFDSLLGPVVISQATFDGSFARAADGITLATLSGTTAAATGALTSALADHPDARILNKEAWVTDRAASIDQLLNLLYVLLGLSVAIALLGMVNTLALSVMERTRELGTLRAVGASRRQLRRMVRHESVVVALIGAAVGLPVGVGLAALVTQALSDYDVSLSLPIGGLVAIALVAVLAAVIAASGPARRASRVQVVKALAQE